MLKVLLKNVFFLNGANFIGIIFLREKKQDTPKSDQSTCKKVISPIGCTATEKMGGGGLHLFF